ncbi:MAG: ChaN family lipoprotein [Pseudomonadota bacterium]
MLAPSILWADQHECDLSALPSAEIYLLGERHDNADHHEIQACYVGAVAPAALVFEMLTADRAEGVPFEHRLDEDKLRETLDWDNSGWPDFSIYYNIFEAAPEAKLYGAAVPRETLRSAFQDGAVGLFGGDANRFGLDRPLPEDEQAEREEMQFNAHCEAMPREMMSGMVDAQRLRDAELARVALQALEETGGPVAVILGNGHARQDWGVPVYLAAASPETSVFSVGLIEGEPEENSPFDLVISGPVWEREDPCNAFKS